MATNTKNTPTLSAEIQRILSENSHLKYLSDTGKIKCSLSGHEMSCDVKVVNSYLHGKKHKRLKALNDYDYDKYRQHLVDSTKRFPKNQLLCLLTYKYINNSQSALQKHINGRKFQRAFKKWEELQKEGKEYTVPKKQPNSSENFENIEKKRKKKSKYEEDEEDESDNDSLSDLYPWEEFQKEGKKCAVSKKQKANCSENIGKKMKKRKYEEEDEEEESDNESLSDLCQREEFQKESKEYVVSKKQKANCSENCKDIGKKRKKKSKYDEEEESDNDSLSDLYPTEEFQKNDDDHKSVKNKKYASESKFKKKKRKKKKNKVAVTV